MNASTDFDDIRPYRDDEVRPTLERILADPELTDAVTRLKFPRASRWLGPVLRPLIQRSMRRQCRDIATVMDFQHMVERYMNDMMRKTGTELTFTGLDRLDPQCAYLFVSNHRDIAMDPAFVNMSLFRAQFNTLRIAIGDNLLTKPYVSDLMRLNKSFIVNRSARRPREKFRAAKKLSAYIHHSIVYECANIWIAQREGRAKDGCDKTNPAVIGMFSLNRPKSVAFGDYIRRLNIVPVSISYELDPCDAAKARELYHLRTQGEYHKRPHEDVASIAKGISGRKGRVHVAFGRVLKGDYADDEAVVSELDRQIVDNYVLHPSNCFAYQMLYDRVPPVRHSPDQVPFDPERLEDKRREFAQRLEAIDPAYRQLALEAYANPVVAHLQQSAEAPC